MILSCVLAILDNTFVVVKSVSNSSSFLIAFHKATLQVSGPVYVAKLHVRSFHDSPDTLPYFIPVFVLPYFLFKQGCSRFLFVRKV